MSGKPMDGRVMMARRGVLRVLAIASFAAVAGCGLIGNSISYRYRLTVEVETPEGLKTGSSVIEVTETDQNGINGSHLDIKVKGEAVAVDLPGGQVLFALLDKASSAAVDAVEEQLGPVPNDENAWRNQIRQVKDQTAIFELPSSITVRGKDVATYPTLVRFRDLSDPRSVEKVLPTNLASSFGPGVRLKRITIQVTDDDVTEGIEKRLGWLPNYYNKMLDGSRINNGRLIANSIDSGSFSIGNGLQ